MAHSIGLRLFSLAALTAVAVATLSSQSRTLDLTTATIAELQAAMDAGALTSERLVELLLKRIDAYEKAGPKLNAILQIHPRAREIARELDRERRATGKRSPLHGIPIAVKDTVDVKDMPSAGGKFASKSEDHLLTSHLLADL